MVTSRPFGTRYGSSEMSMETGVSRPFPETAGGASMPRTLVTGTKDFELAVDAQPSWEPMPGNSWQ